MEGGSYRLTLVCQVAIDRKARPKLEPTLFHRIVQSVITPAPALATEFERWVKQLRLTAEMYTSSGGTAELVQVKQEPRLNPRMAA